MSYEEKLSVQLIQGKINEKQYHTLMKTAHIRVGARVECTYNFEKDGIKGKKGKIVHVPAYFAGLGSDDVGIEFDDYMYGHNANGKAKKGHGWHIPIKYLKILDS